MKKSIDTLKKEATKLTLSRSTKITNVGEGILKLLADLEKPIAPLFFTHEDKTINVGGTCLQGYVNCSYKLLCGLFGKPTKGDGNKVDAEWKIEFPDGKVATIYNYKDGKNYCGKKGIATNEITDWHIGGHDNEVVERLQKIILG